MLEEILNIRNVEIGFKQVAVNKEAGGIDSMQTDELRDYPDANRQTFKNNISEGNYRPKAVRKVGIPKAQGGTIMVGPSCSKGQTVATSYCPMGKSKV